MFTTSSKNNSKLNKKECLGAHMLLDHAHIVCTQCIYTCNGHLTYIHIQENLINKFRCYEAKIEKSEKAISRRESNPGTSGLSRQCCATELWQSDKHQPSQSSICTAQVVLNASVTHLAATNVCCCCCPCVRPFQPNVETCDWCNIFLWSSPIALKEAMLTSTVTVLE